MPCFYPVKAFPACPPARGIVYSASKSYAGATPLHVPCNQCIGCRLAKAQDWATRIHHEASLHEENAFITLTFADEHLPWDNSVTVRDVQLFTKRLRKAVGRFRFFACGEYGDDGGRPHYHILIFGYGFPDKTVWRQTPAGYLTYRSATLEKVWPFGQSEIGTVTHQSAGYVARYVTKKVGGREAVDHYTRVHPLTGEVCNVKPEFICMSNRPGIGSGWYDQFAGDAFPSDFLVIEGRKVPVPRYYAKKLEEDQLLKIKMKRKQRAKKRAADNTPERLAVREEVLQLKAQRLLRDMETTK